jgi:hypothetical protein
MERLNAQRVQIIRESIKLKSFDSLSHKYRYLSREYSLTISQIQSVMNRWGKGNYYNVLNALNARRVKDSF